MADPSTTHALPLTAAQRGLWYALKLAPATPVLNIGQWFDLHGAVDPALLREAFEVALAEAQTLHVRFEEDEDGTPLQRVGDPVRWTWTDVDLSEEEDPLAAAERWMQEDISRPVDPLQDAVLAACTFTTGDDRTLFYQRIHHLHLDGHGAALFMGRVAQVTTALAAGEEVPPPFFGSLEELVAEDAAYEGSEDEQADRERWQRLMGDAPAPSLLADPPEGLPQRVLRRSADLPESTTLRLRRVLEVCGVRLSAGVVAAVAAYVHRFTGSADVVLSLPVTARRGPVAKTTPSMLSNVLPLRVAAAPHLAADELMRRASEAVGATLEAQRYRSEALRADLGLGRTDRLGGPSVNVLPSPGLLSFAGVPSTLHNLSVGPVDDLSVIVQDAAEGSGLHIDLDANPDRYSALEVEGHLARLVRVLEALADEEDLVLGAVDVATLADRDQATSLHAGPQERPLRRTLADLFEAQALRTPDGTALVAGGEELTFLELGRRANRVAHRLVAHGVGVGRTVGVCLPRSADAIVALLAVAKAGATYLPLDPTQPAERIAAILADARPDRVVTHSSVAGALGDAAPTLVLDDPEEQAALAAASEDRLHDAERGGPARPGDPAYVLFTSGSTGRPKGVVVEHAALVNLYVHHHRELFTPAVEAVGGRALRVAHTTALTFDASWDPLLWMLDGHELHLVDDDVRRDPEALVRTLRAARVDAIETTPSFAGPLLDSGLLGGEDGVRVVALGGEAVDAALWTRLAEAEGVLAFNLFGPTEATVDVTSARIGGPRRPTLGRPVHNTRAYVLDNGLQPLPVGAAGELYLAGQGLARAYLNRPDLTAERFVADPHGAPGERMYRTGDRARWREDGTLDFAGRVDDQVKVRGFRVELGEIASVLRGHEDVAEAAVVVRAPEEGVQQLVAYVVAAPGREPDGAALRERVAEQLPAYMVPALVVLLDALPLTPNGKLDQRALPAPTASTAGEEEGEAPRTAREELVASLMARTLGLGRVGRDDDFFDLGGDSLTATRLVSRLRAEAGVELEIRALFEAPTAAGLAGRLGDAGDARPRLEPRERPDPLPLSAAQRRLWFLSRLEPDSAAYDIPAVVRLRGELDVAALEGALGDVVARHEVLRTLLPEGEDGEPRQVVLAPEEAAMALAREDVAADGLQDRLDELATARFDLARDLPLRATLLRVAEDEHALALVLHHVAGDGWSLRPLAADLAEAYRARRAGEQPPAPSLRVQYADYALWQRELLGDEDDPTSVAARQLAHWAEVLQDLPEQLELPTDRPRPAELSAAAGAVEVALPPADRDRLVALAQERGASPFMVLQAAFAALLSRLGAGTDVPIGSPIAGRTDEALDDLVGFFVNTLVLRTDVSGDPSFAELVDRVREADLDAYANQDVPFERLVEALAPERSLARHPLFQVMLAFQNAPAPELELPGLEVSVEAATETAGAKFDLSLDLGEREAADGGREVAGTLTYRSDLLDPPTAASLARRFERLVHAVLADPEAPVGDAPVLDEDERRRVVDELPAGDPAAPPATVLDAWAATVRTAPGRRAVVGPDGELTAGELDARAGRIAAALARRDARGRAVAVLLERTTDLLAAQLGVLRAGAVLLPLDPEHPAGRLAQVVEDADPVLALTRPDLAWVLPDALAALDVEEVAREEGEAPAPPAPGDAAYVLFTSGSTGRPKGVVVEHGALANLLAHHAEHLHGPARAAAGDRPLRVAHTTAVGFDAAWDPVLWMLGGDELHVVADDVRRDPQALVAWLHDTRADVLETTPSYVQALLDLGLAADGRAPGTIALGGEAVGPALWEALRGLDGVRAVNLYGPTEATVDAVVADVADAPVPTLGRPVAGARAYVLDAALRPLPVGATGELYLAGAGLARAYLGRAAQTAERFVADPLGGAPGGRLYRTGDLAAWSEDGTLRFVGRVDDQVKVRGFRVELGEVQAALDDHPDVRRSAAIVRAERGGEGRLVAYVVPAEGREVDVAAVRAHAADRLAPYMAPSSLQALDELPLTVNGKLDRSALPAPEAVTTGRAPATPQEEALVRVFADVLGVEGVGADDSFFDLGGHSLLATRLVSRVRSELGVELPIRALFEAPTVAELAERLGDAGAGRVALGRRERPERPPLSYAQRRLWFLNRLEPSTAAYHIPLAVELEGELDPDALRAAVADVVARHEALRTTFGERGGEPYQRVLGPADGPELDVRDVPAEELDDALRRAAERPFDLEREPPLRALLLRQADDRAVLLLVLHHIAADGWSLGPLGRDLREAYAARRAGRAHDLGEPAVQVVDHALWQREALGDEEDPDSPIRRQLEFWTHQLAGLDDELALPTDRPRPARSSSVGDVTTAALDADLHARIEELARRRGATPFMVLQAALAGLLTRLGAGTDVPLGSPIAGRDEEALEELVGFFVNTLVLRVDTSGDPTFAELLERVRRTDLDAYAHAELPFERLVEALAPERSLARHPVFQVMVSLDVAAPEAPALDGLATRLRPVATGASKFDLSLSLGERRDAEGRPGGIDVTLESSADLFDRTSAEALLARYGRLLDALVRDPDARLGDADLLDADEAAWLDAVAAGPAPPAARPSVVEAWGARVAAAPDARALVVGGEAWTARELDERVRVVAGALTARGVGRGDAVALAVPRSADTVAALLGAQAAGAAAVPLDLDHPPARIAAILDDARPAAVVTTAAHAADLPADAPLLVLDEQEQAPADALRRPDPSDAAYVLFTSGSTGRPKGVVVEHGALANLLAHHRRELHDPAREAEGRPLRVAHTTAVGFDAAWDPVLWMVAGHELHLVGDDERRDPEALLELVDEAQIDVLETTPSYVEQLLAMGLAADDRHRPCVVALGGEAVGPALWSRLRALEGTRALNLYGPTEATVDAVVADLAEHPEPVIGRPVAGVRARVLGPRLEELPVGAVGELHLSGDGLARGYLGDAARTAASFVADPHGAPGARMYRTGDLARRRADGTLRFAGRVDDQVKVRGYRVELGEVQAALEGHPHVERAAAVVREREGAGQLVAYLVPAATAEVDVAGVRAHVADRLPAYMVPTAMAVLDELPLTPNGKLDRRALPEPEGVAGAGGVAPRTPREQVLAGLFAEVLGVERVGVEDSFFDLGGHSLLAGRLVERLRAVTGEEVPMRALFEAPTVAALARRGAEGEDDGGIGPTLVLRAAGERPPLFCVHPASGLAWRFAGLLGHLEDRPLVGLQVPAVAEGDALPPDLDELVAGYVARIRAERPTGPYHLVGFSIGGLVAHHVAAALQDAGEEVALLAMLDSYPTPPPAGATDDELLAAFLVGQGHDVAEEDRPLDGARARAVLQRGDDVLGSLEPSVLDALLAASVGVSRLLAEREPGRVAGDLWFATAGRTRPDGPPLVERWAAHVDGEVRDHPVDSEHSLMLSAATLADLGPLLARALDEADAAATPTPSTPTGADA